VRGFLLGLSLGHPRSIHRRAHCDRGSHAVRTARIDAMDRDASVGARAALVSRFRSSRALAAYFCANFGIKKHYQLMTLARFCIEVPMRTRCIRRNFKSTPLGVGHL